MASWTITAQLTDSTTLALNAGDHVWWSGATYADSVLSGQYQDSTHIASSTDVERCLSVHVHNTKYVNDNEVSIDGAAASALPVAIASCPLKLTFTDTSAVATTSGKLYAYDGAVDANPMGGVSLKAAEGGVSASWVAANGLDNALQLASQAAATTHDFFVALSLSPNSTGSKSGKIKVSLNYI